MDRSNSIRLERAKKQYEHLLLNAGEIISANELGEGNMGGFPYGLAYHTNSHYDNYSNYNRSLSTRLSSSSSPLSLSLSLPILSLKSSKLKGGLSSSGIHAAESIFKLSNTINNKLRSSYDDNDNDTTFQTLENEIDNDFIKGISSTSRVAHEPIPSLPSSSSSRFIPDEKDSIIVSLQEEVDRLRDKLNTILASADDAVDNVQQSSEIFKIGYLEKERQYEKQISDLTRENNKLKETVSSLNDQLKIERDALGKSVRYLERLKIRSKEIEKPALANSKVNIKKNASSSSLLSTSLLESKSKYSFTSPTLNRKRT